MGGSRCLRGPMFEVVLRNRSLRRLVIRLYLLLHLHLQLMCLCLWFLLVVHLELGLVLRLQLSHSSGVNRNVRQVLILLLILWGRSGRRIESLDLLLLRGIMKISRWRRW